MLHSSDYIIHLKSNVDIIVAKIVKEEFKYEY